MMRTLTRLFAVIYVAVLWMPTLQRAFHLFPEPQLYGSEQKPESVQLSVKTWFDGTYSAKYEPWFNYRLGLRSYLVRTYNQLDFTLFRMVPRQEGSQVVIGKEGMLYEQVYVQRYNRANKTSDEKLRRIARRVRQLQDELQQRGIALLVVIAPSKVEIYPENVPDGMLKPGREQRKTPYDAITPLLQEYGVNHIDGHRLFKAWKKDYPYPLFPLTGVHWNYLGAARIIELIMQDLERLTGKKLPQIEIEDVKVDNQIRGTDNDLGELLNVWTCGELLNIWTFKKDAGPQHHPVIRRIADESTRVPDILFVGDSFVHTLNDLMDEHELYQRRDTLYYHKRRFTKGGAKGTGYDRASFDMEKELLGRDALVLEINEYWMPDIGFGFVKDALAFFGKGDAGSEDDVEPAADR